MLKFKKFFSCLLCAMMVFGLSKVPTFALEGTATGTHGLADAIEEIQDSELFGEYLSFTDAVDVARRKTCLAIKPDGTVPGLDRHLYYCHFLSYA